MQKIWFVTGISTEIGKTISSAILTEALEADYWKPVQAGDLHNTDSNKIESYITNKKTVVHPEQYCLQTPMSPHAAADIDGVKIKIKDFQLPKTKNHLIIEGAGGLMVPLNEKKCIIDLIKYLEIPVVLVTLNYLGSINHTLLSIEALRSRNIPIEGLIFNGQPTPTTEDIITKMANLPIIGHIPRLNDINKVSIKEVAESFKKKMKKREKQKSKNFV